MKRFIIYFVVLFCFCSCSDFLDLTPKNKQVVYNLEDVKVEMAHFLFAVQGTATVSYNSRAVGFPFHRDISFGFSMYSDDLGMEHFLSSSSGKSWQDTYLACVDWKGVDMARDMWENFYCSVGYLNNILKDLENTGQKDQADYERIQGEAKVFRAYYVFKLLQFFAPYGDNNLGIPLVTDAEIFEGSPRWKQTDLYAFITGELKEVLNYRTVPEKWNVMFNREIIQAILSQVYMFKSGSAAKEEDDWKQAEFYSGEILKNRSLETTIDQIRDLFLVQESVFGFTKDHPYALLKMVRKGSYLYFPNYNGIWGLGAEGQIASEELWSLFTDPDDIRLPVFFRDYLVDNVTMYYVNKFRYTASSLCDYSIFFRIADIYLINAEAHARLGEQEKAKEMLEHFKKSRIPGFVSYEGADVLSEILKERRKELCFEFDSRWVDMKRLGVEVKRRGFSQKAGEEMQLKEFQLAKDDYRYALPIPVEDEIMYNHIPQNPGWMNVK